MRVAGAQIDLTVGDFAGNEAKIAAMMDWGEADGADVLLLPELAVTGYPPEDLVLRHNFVRNSVDCVERLARRSGEMTTVVGFVDHTTPSHFSAVDAHERRVANAAAVIQGGRVQGIYHKMALPNYGVFDEDRYFAPGDNPAQVFEIGGVTCGISICEDVWLDDGPPLQQARAGANVLLNINASPFTAGKAATRESLLVSRAKDAGVPLVFVNLVGGQDELVFDGCSVVISAEGEVVHRSPQFVEDRFVIDLGDTSGGEVSPRLSQEAEIWGALKTGLAGYVEKNGFDGVVLGFSGGIDSALTAAVAVDALGPDRVWGVAMPSRYSSDHSISDAKELAVRLGCRFDEIPIEEAHVGVLDTLSDMFEGTAPDLTEENLQARIRGLILMALSNKFGPMVLATGNKSEMAVGYSTIYGDMVGGYAPIKDVYKTDVHRLARWRNRRGEVIPENTITKPPSAELRPDQRDADSLPPYEILDAILRRYIEADMSVDDVIADGFDTDVVRRVALMVDRSEYKRRQGAIGTKVSSKAFGRDRRLPISNAYRPGRVVGDDGDSRVVGDDGDSRVVGDESR
ncbi:MAG: NAD+ synthase [Acidimicrobiia bacterium]|nr:NAD+ synthase [Acidimicrobiia bacterium]